jgi:hypothetical protein
MRSAPLKARHRCTSSLSRPAGPLNRVFGRGTLLRGRVADAALSAKDRVPEPLMRVAMQVLRPPRK